VPRTRADTLPLIAQPGDVRVVTIGLDAEQVAALRGVALTVTTIAVERGDALVMTERITSEEPDLVVMAAAGERDLGVCKQLKILPESHFIPVLIMGPAALARAAYEAGADHIAESLTTGETQARGRALVRSGAVARAVRSSRQELRLRRDWVRYLVHDLRNLLTKALGQIALVGLRVKGDASLREMLLGAEEELWRGTALLADFLDVDRIRKGSLHVRRAPTNLVELAGKVAETYREPAARVGLDVSVADGEIVEASVDAGLIERVVGNLIANALRFAPAGSSIVIRVADDGDAATLSVENRGPSIPAADVPHMFEPFVRGDSRSAGSGLGLAFCRLVAEMHEGGISVGEPDGGGARFTVVLPKALSETVAG
jgi:signal transduction histidine kinase